MQDHKRFCEDRILLMEERKWPLSSAKSFGILLDKAESAWFQTYSAGLSSGA